MLAGLCRTHSLFEFLWVFVHRPVESCALDADKTSNHPRAPRHNPTPILSGGEGDWG